MKTGRILKIAILTVTGAVCAGIAAAAESPAPTLSPRPDWVEVEPLPEVSQALLDKAEEGNLDVLHDRQIRIGEDDYVSYRRSVRRIVSQAGLEDAGRLEFVFDPEEDRFRIHSVKVIRDGESFDRFDPGALKVVQREPELSDGVTDGDLTVYYEVPDIRIGDAVEYEISWEARSKIWPGEYFSDFSVEWSVPVAFSRTRILAPAGKPLTIAAKGAPPQPEITGTGAMRAYQWLRRNPPIVRGEDYTPPTFASWSAVSVSTIASWREVAGTLVEPYEAAAAMPDDLAMKIVPAEGALEDRVTAAIRYVQDEIRYVADETGVGSHLPRSPQIVVERGWGDCKDKATLLVAILRRLGIEAYVALTDNDAGRALPQSAPSPFAFDHAIVAAIYQGKTRWIDATMSLQGGVFPDIEPPSFGFGLAVKAGVDGLWTIDAASPDAPSMRTIETFDFAGRDAAGVEVAVVSDYLGPRADAMRRTLESESSGSLARKYLEYYQKLYPGIERKSDLVFSDDRAKNAIRVEEKYLLPAGKLAEDDLKTSFPIQADAVRNLVNSVGEAARRSPVSLPYPLHAEHIVSIKNAGVEMSGIDEFAKTTEDFEFVRNAIPEKDSVWISWRFKTLASELPVARIGDYRKLVDEMDDWNYAEYNLDEGAADLGPMAQATLISVLLLIVGIFAGFWGAGAAIKADNEIIDRSIFHPMAVRKFLILGFATLGLYAVFWMFRCWRAHKRAESLAISPAARAFFSVIFFFPLFSAIREKTPEGTQPPIALGAALAAAWGLLTVISSVVSNNMKEPGWPQALVGVSDSVIFLAVVPLLFWVNQLNREHPEIAAAHSRWTARTFAALYLGLSSWAVILTASFVPA